MKTRREFLKTLPAGAAALTSAVPFYSCSKAVKERPNVILIMTDDQGYGDFGVTGNPLIRTPNLDTMAGQSAQMTNFYVSPVCAPTRASLMTGRYNYRTRCIDTWMGRALMEPAEVTIAEIMRSAGYTTGIFGKWHLGDNYPMRPQDQGFDEVLVHRGGGIGQPSDPPGGERKYTDPVLFRNGSRVQEKGYCTDVYFDRGMEWMEKMQRTGQNFFMYISTNAPHGPFHDVPMELYEEYKKINLSNDRFPQDKGHKLPENRDTDKRARIYAMITNIDDNIGKLYKKLNSLKILENTIVVFLTDNGPNGRRYAAGMKGRKSTVYEGGIRSPLFFHWPAGLKSGKSSDRIAAHIDIMPTILDACGLNPPRDLTMDGRSFLPLLKGSRTDWADRNIVIQSHRGDVPNLYHNFALRNQRWKLLNSSGFGRKKLEGIPKFELYDMETDPLEMKDLAEEKPDKVEELKKAYEDWFADVGSTRPDNYSPPRIYIGTQHENPVVLTRQDWRSEAGWSAEGANGYWRLYAAVSGKYDFKVRLDSKKENGEVELTAGGLTKKTNFTGYQNEFFFRGVELNRGNLDLQINIKSNGKTYGPWHVDVIKI